MDACWWQTSRNISKILSGFILRFFSFCSVPFILSVWNRKMLFLENYNIDLKWLDVSVYVVYVVMLQWQVFGNIKKIFYDREKWIECIVYLDKINGYPNTTTNRVIQHVKNIILGPQTNTACKFWANKIL